MTNFPRAPEMYRPILDTMSEAFYEPGPTARSRWTATAGQLYEDLQFHRVSDHADYVRWAAQHMEKNNLRIIAGPCSLISFITQYKRERAAYESHLCAECGKGLDCEC